MAGRPRKVRCIQSYINNSDAHSGIGPMKQGTPTKIGVTHYYWYNLQTQATSIETPLNRFQTLTGAGKYTGFGNLIWLGIKPPPYRASPFTTQNQGLFS
jgi:hypothetical protein